MQAGRAISARDDKSHKLWTGDYSAAFAQASDVTPATLDTKLPPAARKTACVAGRIAAVCSS